MTFSSIRSAIDLLRNRLPGALAMMKASDVAVSLEHRANSNSVVVSYFFNNRADCGNAYRACERLYEFDRIQREPRP